MKITWLIAGIALYKLLENEEATTLPPQEQEPPSPVYVPFFSHVVNNPIMRGTDNWGSGYFGAPRRNANGTRYTHRGVDVIVFQGQSIFSPISGYVKRYAKPYGDADPKWFGVLIEGTGKHLGLEMKIFYFLPYPSVIGRNIIQGEYIGDAQKISERFPGMTDHVHVEVRQNGNLIDPTGWLFEGA